MLRYCPYCGTNWDDRKPEGHSCQEMRSGAEPIPDAHKTLYNALLDAVMDEIEGQMALEDYEAIYELLAYIPTPYLIGFLGEERWNEFKELKGVRQRN